MKTLRTWFLAPAQAALLLFTGCTAQAESKSTAELLAAAPVFELLLDSSEDSPATKPTVVEAVWPEVERELRRQPLGTRVIVASAGDPAVPPLVWRSRVQQRATADGLPLDALVREVKARMLGFPALVAAEAPQKASHLVQGFFDAARNLNPQASQPNTIFFVTDLVEYSPLAKCNKLASCKLPAPLFKIENTRLHVYGVGMGLSSEAAMPLFRVWEQFFHETGIAALEFHRGW